MSEPSELYIVSADHDRAILIGDKQDHNDIAEFFHADHATVGQSYEYALSLAQFLVERPTLLAERDALKRQVEVMREALRELKPALLADFGSKGGLSEHGRKRACDIVRAALSVGAAL